MRRLLASGLLALGGCNAIFGLNDNAKIGSDATVFPDGPLMTFKLRYLLADTEVVPPDILNQPAPIRTVGIPGVTDTRVGALGGELLPAPYDPETGDVGVLLPELLAAPWRFRYTLDGAQHEIQWQPALQDAKASEPMIGRLQSAPPPPDSGYNIQPALSAQTPPVGGYNGSRVFTTGVFLDIRTGTSPSSTQVDGTANKTFLGALGTPEASRGDNAVLVNYAAPLGMCGATVDGFAQFRPPGLLAGTKVPITPAPEWTVSNSNSKTLSVTYSNLGLFAGLPRLGSALKDSTGGRNSIPANVIEHGITASTALPGIVVERPVTIGASTFTVPGPHMLMLAQCQMSISTFNNFLLPFELENFPRVTHGFLSDRRAINGVELVSSLISVDDVEANSSVVDFRAPLAIHPITLTDVDSNLTSLSGGTDGVPISVATPLALSFGLESGQAQLALAVDYFEISVFEIANNTLTKKRVFVTTNVAAAVDPPRVITTPIPLDLTGLTPGTYVLRIRAVAGAPRAALGDFEAVTYPYSAASIFTRTFVVQ